MPDPTKGEKKEDFVSRCVSMITKEGKSQEQAVAICLTKWENKNKKSESSCVTENTNMNDKLAKAQTELKIAIANMDTEKEYVTTSQMMMVISRFQEVISYQNEEIDYLHRRFDRHEDGHLPKVKGAAQMKKAVSALGLDEEYEVKSEVLYASEKNGITIKGCPTLK